MNKQAKIWLALIIAPIAILFLVMFLSVVLKFVFTGTTDNSESTETIQTLFNIIIWLFGSAAVFLLLFMPLFVIMLIITLSRSPSSKTTAVILAVFFGALSWLYTYKTDATKFWVNNIVSLLTFGLWGVVAWVWAIVDYAVRPKEFYYDYTNKYVSSNNL